MERKNSRKNDICHPRYWFTDNEVQGCFPRICMSLIFDPSLNFDTFIGFSLCCRNEVNDNQLNCRSNLLPPGFIKMQFTWRSSATYICHVKSQSIQDHPSNQSTFQWFKPHTPKNTTTANANVTTHHRNGRPSLISYNKRVRHVCYRFFMKASFIFEIEQPSFRCWLQ